MINKLLMFGIGNKKLGNAIHTFSLPAGHTCPFAKECLSKCVVSNGKAHIQDGSHCTYRCFSANEELIKLHARQSRWNNFNKLLACKTLKKMINLIDYSIPVLAKTIRIHVSGDFFSETYFKAWLAVIKKHPDIKFYCYTKAVKFVLKYKEILPSNFIITFSYGGVYDDLIPSSGFKSAKVILYEHEANGLEIDTDDSHAYNGTQDFVLVIHSTQPAGTEASKAWSQIKKQKMLLKKSKELCNNSR